MDNTRKVDEFDVDFEDTSSFVAWRYQDIINIISDSLTEEDQLTCKEARTWQDLLKEIRRKVMDPKSTAVTRRLMASIQPFPRSMATLNGSFISAVTPQRVQFDFLWGLVYLNLKLSYSSTDKLKRTAEWLGSLRRNVELFSLSLNVSGDDLNEPRLAMIDIYDHILSMLQEALLHLRSNTKDADATKQWPQINSQLQQHFSALDSTVRHLNDIANYSKVNQENTVKNLSLRYAPVPESEEHTSFPCVKVPWVQNDKFFGRKSEMQKIVDHLTPDKETSELRTYTIYGRRGVGKTEIALQYVYENPSEFEAIFWIQCETSVSLRQSFTDVAVALNLPGANALGHHEENLLAVQKWLKLTKRRWLLIFDNAEDETILRGYWPVGAKGAILITSRRYYNFMKDAQRKGDTVKPFNEQQSFDLLLVLLGDTWQNQYTRGVLLKSEIVAAKTLLKKIGGLALAIQQAAVLINNPNIGQKNIAGALELFNSNAQRLPERPDTDRSEMVHALDTLWNMNFSILTPNARNLLSVLSMLSPDQMIIDLFQPKRQSALSVNYKLSFIRHSGYRNLPDDVPENLANVIISPALEVALSELLKAGLIKRDNRTISVHRVVQEAMNWHSIEDLQASFDAAVSIVYEAFPKAWTGDILHNKWPTCQTYITHGVHICKKFIDYTQPSSRTHLKSTDTFTALIANCSWYLYEIGDYDTCIKLAETASNACDDKQSTRFANLRNTTGTCYFDMNRLQDCRRDYQIALAIQENEAEHDTGRVAFMLHNMGNLETGSARYEEALEYYNKAIKIRQQQGDHAAGQLALTYLCIGRLHYFKGQYDEASQFLQQAEALFVRTVGADTHFMAFVHFAYGNIEFARKHERSAKRSYLDALKIAAAGTPIHFITSAIYYRLGCVELALKNNDAAKSYLDKALAIAELRSPSRNDGNIARIVFKLSKVLENDLLNNWKAQEMLHRAEMAKKELTGGGEGGPIKRVEVLDDEGNVDYTEQDEDYDALVPIFFR